jgi:predicted phosphodiesterase
MPDIPAWPIVQPARPCIIKPTTTTNRRRTTKGWRTALILPDPQIGFRMVDGKLDPFHDETAMKAGLRLAAELQPDLIVNLGDFLDLAEFSRFDQEPGFANTTQASLDRGHRFLVEQRATAPNAEIVLLEGNHDWRLLKSIMANAKAAFGLRQANTPESWPVLSMQHLLRLDEIGVEYVDGWPAGVYWVNDNLACIHGLKVRSAGSTAAAVVDDERVSVIFGHVHRIELLHKTRRTKEGRRQSFAATPGCLCRVDGAVPSMKGAINSRGQAVHNVENWQHGLAVVTYKPGDSPFHLELVPIFDGHVMFRGQELGGLA